LSAFVHPPSDPWWDPYVWARGEEFDSFWGDRLAQEKDVLLILGRGFDPRMLKCASRISNIGGAGKRDYVLINVDYEIDVAADTSAQDNIEILETLNWDQIDSRDVPLTDAQGHRNVARNAIEAFSSVISLYQYGEVILDISAMPRIVFLPIMCKILRDLVQPEALKPLASKVNFHVTYAESAVLDETIKKEHLADELTQFPGFSVRTEEEATENWPVIWFPVMGNDVSVSLSRIAEKIARPQLRDICPVLPMATKDPRRADTIIRKNGSVLFRELRADPENILYVAEDNPFQSYRSIYRSMRRYVESLSVLEGVKLVMSPLSSKSLSVGAMLACVELQFKPDNGKSRIGVAYIEPLRYSAAAIQNGQSTGEPRSLWLTGECYE